MVQSVRNHQKNKSKSNKPLQSPEELRMAFPISPKTSHTTVYPKTRENGLTWKNIDPDPNHQFWDSKCEVFEGSIRFVPSKDPQGEFLGKKSSATLNEFNSVFKNKEQLQPPLTFTIHSINLQKIYQPTKPPHQTYLQLLPKNLYQPTNQVANKNFCCWWNSKPFL